jgi:diguanylate cyclase (GGDEF)-like protein
MEPILSENLAMMHYGLILVLTCAQLLIVYFLSESSSPPQGLGLFTVYFMAALMGWILFLLQHNGGQGAGSLDFQAIVGLLSSYVLFLAAGQRSGVRWGRKLLATCCLAACFSAFFVAPGQMFLVQLAGIGALWTAVGLLCAYRANARHNVGDGLIALAGLLVVTGFAAAWWRYAVHGELAQGQGLAFGVHSTAYALVVVGFLASVLLDYQHHLSHLTTEDPLTHLLNRRGLDDALYVSLASASRHNGKTSAIGLDIDQLRQVNDSFGHDLGDRVIQRIAEILQRTCRASDAVARVGGEEFLVVMPGTDEQAARALAERVRVAIAEQPLLLEGHSIPLTVSLGVATVEGGTDLDRLAREADRALFLAKRGGHNRVASVDSRPRHFRNDGPIPGQTG